MAAATTDKGRNNDRKNKAPFMHGSNIHVFILRRRQRLLRPDNMGHVFKESNGSLSGGHQVKDQNGITTYGVVRPFSGLSTAYILFNFSPKMTLISVTIFFPKQGSNVNLVKATFDKTTVQEAKSIRDTVLSALILEYGAPDKMVSTEKLEAWETKAGDVVVLNLTPDSEDSRAAQVGILYQKIPQLDELSKGL